MAESRTLKLSGRLLFACGRTNDETWFEIDRLGNDRLIGFDKLKGQLSGALADDVALLVHTGQWDPDKLVIEQVAASDDGNVFRNPQACVQDGGNGAIGGNVVVAENSIGTGILAKEDLRRRVGKRIAKFFRAVCAHNEI